MKTPEAPAPTPAPTPTTEAPKPANDMPEVTLVYAEVNPLDSIVGQMATFYKEKVAELSGGKITIDMSRISAFALTPYGGEKSKLLSIPFTFASREHFWNFATSDLNPEFLLEPHENGSGVRDMRDLWFNCRSK